MEGYQLWTMEGNQSSWKVPAMGDGKEPAMDNVYQLFDARGYQLWTMCFTTMWTMTRAGR